MWTTLRKITTVALVTASLALGSAETDAAELSELCEAANAPELDSRYRGMTLGEDATENFAVGETLTVSATNSQGPLVAIAIMVTEEDILIDQDGPDFTLTHTYVQEVNTASWVAIIGQIEFGDADWTVTCAGAPPPEISPFGLRVTEPAAGTSVIVQVPVFLSTESDEVITVDYATIDDQPAPEATSGEDFVPTSGTLTFQPGETVAYVPVEVLGDGVAEEPLYGGEWALVQFSNPSVNSTLDSDTFFGAGLIIIRDG